jgi:glycosyltransferase involved in cell wall biosynthesis
MIFSLIVPTIRRTQELARLLESIAGQKLKSLNVTEIETIIVDQNEDDRLVNVIRPYAGRMPLFHFKSPPLGQSHGKNIGIKSFRGKFVAFPDDDCFYPEDTLEKVFQIFRETGGKYVIFGRSMEKESGKTPLDYPTKERIISRPGDPAVFLGIQYAQFYTADMVLTAGDFDTSLRCEGVVSSEETDYAIRCVRRGIPIQYHPEIVVHHPLVVAETMNREKLRKYAFNFGALCRKQGLYRIAVWKSLKQLAGMLYFFFKLNFRRSAGCRIVVLGRIKGFLGYRNDVPEQGNGPRE